MRALIVGNGEPPSRALYEALLATSPDLLLCADGGADTVRRYGGIPDAVVGDLDSAAPATLSQTPRERRVCIDADDTGTDLNKVLTYAVGRGVTEAVLVGVLRVIVGHGDGECLLDGCVVFVGGSDAYAEGNRDRLMVKGRIGFEGAMGVEMEEMVVGGATAVGKGKDGPISGARHRD